MGQRLKSRQPQFDGVGVATHRKCSRGRSHRIDKVVAARQPEMPKADSPGRITDCELKRLIGGPDRRLAWGTGKSKADHLRAAPSRELPDVWIVVIEDGPI